VASFAQLRENDDLPASVQAEVTILGAMLMEPAAIVEATATLVADDFSLDSHRRIYAAMAELSSAGRGVDYITVREVLARKKELDAIGGPAYLAFLTEGIPRNLNIEGHARIVKDRALQRRLIGILESGLARISDQSEDAGESLSAIQAELSDAAESGSGATASPIASLVVPYYNHLKSQWDHSGEVLGIPTGIPALDRETSGWRDGELTYVGAIPGRGKTSFLIQCMYSAAASGIPAGCISMEMRSNQLFSRLNILHSGLNSGKFRDPRTMTSVERDIARRSTFALGDLPIDMCDQSGLRPWQISSLSRQMVRRGAKIIFIDFVQIIREDGKDRREAINRVSAAIRDVCKELNVPFVVASQLARRDADPNRRPTLMDLRESGNLEQDAHNVFMLYRPKDKVGEWTGEDEIIIEKQREGVIGIVNVYYDWKLLKYVERSGYENR
jgi:replicative DNA helicase